MLTTCFFMVFDVFLKSGSSSTSCGGASSTTGLVGICFFLPCPLCPGCPPGFLPLFSRLLEIFFFLIFLKTAWRNSHNPGSSVPGALNSCLFPLQALWQSHTAGGAARLFFLTPHPSGIQPLKPVFPVPGLPSGVLSVSCRILSAYPQISETTGRVYQWRYCGRAKALPAAFRLYAHRHGCLSDAGVLSACIFHRT